MNLKITSQISINKLNFRYINELSGDDVPGGVTWGLYNREASPPSGWNNDLLDFYKYGGPGKKYEGNGKLPAMIKDVLIHYMYLLGVNPNEHAVDIPSNYENRWLDDLGFIPPPAHFILPDWATPCQPGDNDTEEERSSYFVRSSARPSNAEEFLSSSSSMTSPSQTPPPASPIRKPKATKGRQRPRSPSSSPSPSPQPRSRAARLRDEPPASPPPPPTYPSSPPPPPSKRKIVHKYCMQTCLQRHSN